MGDDDLKGVLLKDASFGVGLGVGYGQTRYDQTYPGLDLQARDKSDVLQAYIQARNRWLGAEAGLLQLPQYHSTARTDNYPAYRGVAAGPGVPQTAAISQDITATAPYLRANLYGPTLFGVEPYLFGGKARVRTDNHEYGNYDGTEHVDYRNADTINAKYYGLGLETLLSKNIKLRAEVGRIPHASNEYHTGDRNMTFGLLGLGAMFQ